MIPNPDFMIPNPYSRTVVCVNRLFEQYTRTPKLIIAVDFDDTIFDFHNGGYEYSELIELLKRAQKLGFYIVCFTASAPDRHGFIRNYCNAIGIKLDAINDNVVETPYGKHGKIFYNLLLDDRAGLGQATEILEELLYRIENKIN